MTDDAARPFADADTLIAPPGNDAELVSLLREAVRADVAGVSPGAADRLLAGTAADRERIAFALGAAFNDDDLLCFIEATDARRARAVEIALAASLPDPSPQHNGAALAALASFSAWGDYAFHALIVPGYTPIDLQTPTPGVHPTAARRLAAAKKELDVGSAPFVIVSGGNVYPRGTPYYEAMEMKKALLAMGVAEHAILVEARARHSTTNLRNAGRIMLAQGMARALIVTVGGGIGGGDVFGQDFYFANPTLSSFYARCDRELGYRVGDLEDAAASGTAFVPAGDVRTIGYRDPLDP